MHKLLEEQLVKIFGDNLIADEKLNELIICVNNTYQNLETKISENCLNTVGTENDLAQNKLKQYTEELEKKNKELDQFAYIVSHDLKAPLRGINNISTWIEEDLKGKIDEEVKNNLFLLKTRVKRMENLIDGILDYSRAGRLTHTKSEVDINQLLAEIISNLSPPKHIKFKIDENLPLLITEKLSLEQVFTNYISNAIKYNFNKQPIIEIGFEPNQNFYNFYVKDNGDGIDKQFHEKVFAIFQTLQSRDKFESTGVGLAIVKKIVEEFGGRVWIDENQENGCKFWFSWPINEVEVNTITNA